MRCSKCGAENPERKKFCGDCGTPLANLCPKCGAENPAGKRFCGECGTPLRTPLEPAHKESALPPIQPAEAPAHENVKGERKPVTALFANIKGSMDLIKNLDPKE